VVNVFGNDAMKNAEDGGMSRRDAINRIILENYPDVQAIYIFGSHDTEDEWPDSDIDIGLLFPPSGAKEMSPLALSSCRAILADYMRKDVDLVNLRQVSTVFQKEIIATGRLLYCASQYAVDEFEMLVMSYYQKLNQERREHLDAFMETGRAYRI